ncbi:hypothetical protein HPB48_007798 [Haemaphysalis longicornis]|uniref:Uncharacterized protein n=1 Tax=Haemaphysalis longicornis TaxID=44386 RepID=A0A9J6FC77_HAELO|nr:hypothetical protein HPB48_007798 [Haemaphysalis longicornis]
MATVPRVVPQHRVPRQRSPQRGFYRKKSFPRTSSSRPCGSTSSSTTTTSPTSGTPPRKRPSGKSSGTSSAFQVYQLLRKAGAALSALAATQLSDAAVVDAGGRAFSQAGCSGVDSAIAEVSFRPPPRPPTWRASGAQFLLLSASLGSLPFPLALRAGKRRRPSALLVCERMPPLRCSVFARFFFNMWAVVLPSMPTILRNIKELEYLRQRKREI